MAERPPEFDLAGGQVVDAVFGVHGTCGPGLVEGVYEPCFTCERGREIVFQRQVVLLVLYRNKRIWGAGWTRWPAGRSS
jgi:hypothetical protein